MRLTTISVSALLVALLITVGMVQAQISGSIDGTIRAGTFTVDGDVTVDAGNSLTIEPGATLLFTGHYSFKVYGTMIAEGTENDPISFKHQNPVFDNEWGGVRFMAGCSPNSILSYVHVEYAKYHLWPDISGGGVYIEEDGVTVSNCTIVNNYADSGGGIYINGAAVEITDCYIANNTGGNGGGIYVYNSTGVVVSGCEVAFNTSTST